jgi:hypothetical protein
MRAARFAPALAAVALLAIVALLGFVLSTRRGADDSAAAVVVATPESDAIDSDAPLRGLRRGLRIRLLPDAGVPAAPASVRIGLAMLSPEELAAHRAWLRDGARGAGAADPAALAAVVRWIDASAQRAPDGAVIVGPLDLPAADRYVLQARGEDGLRFYEAAFVRDAMPTELRPRVAAGLRVRAPRGVAATLLLRRTEAGAQTDAAWQSLLRREAPQVLAAYDERPLPLGEDTAIAPLPPGPVEIVAMVGGIEIERRTLQLSAGRYLALDLDAEAARLGAALSSDLDLRLVERGSGAPVREVEVLHASARGERRLRPDPAGTVRIADIDPLEPLSLQLLFASPRASSFLIEALPTWPERMPVELDLRAAPRRDGRIAKTLELQPLRWLIVDTPGMQMPQRPRMGEPFPVFVLQRRERGQWRDAQADHFRPQPGGVAVSLDRPGTVRVVALASPWRQATSPAVEIGDGDTRLRTRLASASGRRVVVRLLANGRPLARSPVEIVAALRGVPPMRMFTDAEGRLMFDDANVSALWLEAPGHEQVEVRLDRAAADDAIVIALPPARG